MKKNLRQQIMTAISLALIVMTVAVSGLASGRARAGAVGNQRSQTGRSTLTAGTYGRGIIMANTEGDFKARRQSQAASSNGAMINWGDGHDQLRTAGTTSHQLRGNNLAVNGMGGSDAIHANNSSSLVDADYDGTAKSRRRR